MRENKQQVVFVHGGETFATYDDFLKTLKSWSFDPSKTKRKRWSAELQKDLGNNFDVVSPLMPNKYNAKYVEWKIWFDKVIPFLTEDSVFVGHSLGTIFLVKYLSENKINKKIKALFLVAPVLDGFDEKGEELYSMADFVLQEEKIPKVEDQVSKIFIYHSKDDFVVPFFQAEKYVKIFKDTRFRVFEDRNHFLQESLPEIITDIKSLDNKQQNL